MVQSQHPNTNPAEESWGPVGKQDEYLRSIQELRGDIEKVDQELAKQIDALTTPDDLVKLREQVEGMQLNSEVKEKFLQLVRNVENASKNERSNLLQEILSDTQGPRVSQDMFPSHHLRSVHALEESPLGQNVAKDIAGVAVGSVDSVGAVVKLGWTLIKDAILLPRDIGAFFSSRR